MEVEPLEQAPLEDIGLNTCNDNLTLSSREFPSVDEPEPQPLHNLSYLDEHLGDKRGTDPPINQYYPGSFRMKEAIYSHLILTWHISTLRVCIATITRT